MKLMNVKRNISIFLIGGILMFMFGCREYRMYEYKGLTYDLSDGSVYVNLVGRFGENREVRGKKIADYTFPYRLRFIVSIPYGKPFEGLLVKDVELVGEKTLRRYRLGEKKAARINDPRAGIYPKPKAKARTAIVLFGPLLADEYEYENFILNATILTTGENGEVIEDSISMLLRTNFRKEYRNDWLDEQLSV